MRKILCLAIVGLMIFGCKPSSPKVGSDAKDLENFVGRNHTNTCSPKNLNFNVQDLPAGMDQKLAPAYFALPPKLRDEVRNLKVPITYDTNGDLNKICNPPEFGIKNEKPDGCVKWVIKKDPDGKRAYLTSITFHLGSSSDQLVRLFGFYLSQISPRLNLTDNTYSLSSERKDIHNLKEELANSFIVDVVSIKSNSKTVLSQIMNAKINMNSLQIEVGEALQAIAAHKEDHSPNFFQHIEFNAGEKLVREDYVTTLRRQQFASYVMAEAFDSYFCNNWSAGGRDNPRNTLSYFKANFPQTHRVFEKNRLINPPSPGMNLQGDETWSDQVSIFDPYMQSSGDFTPYNQFFSFSGGVAALAFDQEGEISMISGMGNFPRTEVSATGPDYGFLSGERNVY